MWGFQPWDDPYITYIAHESQRQVMDFSIVKPKPRQAEEVWIWTTNMGIEAAGIEILKATSNMKMFDQVESHTNWGLAQQIEGFHRQKVFAHK